MTTGSVFSRKENLDFVAIRNYLFRSGLATAAYLCKVADKDERSQVTGAEAKRIYFEFNWYLDILFAAFSRRLK